MNFGSSGHLTKQKSIINSYLKGIPHDKGLIKSIVNTDYVNECKNPHSFSYKNGYYCVNELGIKIISEQYNAFSLPISQTKIQINHYITRSLEEFEIKLKRGGGNNKKSRGIKLRKRFDDLEVNGKEETSILNLINKKK
jgi:hypothetical protein